MCVRLAIQLGIFHNLKGRNGLPISAGELATACGAEELFIGKQISEIDREHCTLRS